MYVERKSVQDLPEGAQILTEDEVVAYYNNHLFGTTHNKDIWYLKYGFCIAGGSAFCTSFYMVDYYRRRCKIHSLVSATLLNLCFVAVPSALALMFHYTECRRRILLQNLCINCLYGRAVVFHNLFSIVYGLGPSALGCLVFAGTMNTYPVPGITNINDMRETYVIWKKFTKRKIPALCVLLVVNTTLITFLTKKELEDKDRLDAILKEQHEKLRAVAAQYEEKK